MCANHPQAEDQRPETPHHAPPRPRPLQHGQVHAQGPLEQPDSLRLL